MFDDPNKQTAVFDFDELANHLVEQGLQSSPSEIHGCLTGLLTSGAPVEAELALVALTDVLDLGVTGELAAQTMELFNVTASALQDEEFDFHPLLPDDETAISQRVESLASWCAGFLGGFAQGIAASGKAEAVLGKDSQEILQDIEAFSQAEADDEREEDEAEEAYFEIVEYLRMAVLNVHMDCASQADE